MRIYGKCRHDGKVYFPFPLARGQLPRKVKSNNSGTEVLGFHTFRSLLRQFPCRHFPYILNVIRKGAREGARQTVFPKGDGTPTAEENTGTLCTVSASNPRPRSSRILRNTELHEFTSDHAGNHRNRFVRYGTPLPDLRLGFCDLRFSNLEISRTDESERTHKLKTSY